MEIEEYHNMNYLTYDWMQISHRAIADGNCPDIKKIRLKDGQVITQIVTQATALI
jgi:hypothetical protein